MKLKPIEPSPRALMGVVLLACILIQLFTITCPDVAWLLLGTDRMLQGATLYRDVMEPNPPLIFWLYALPVKLARQYGFDQGLSLKFCAIALTVLVLLLINALLKRSVYLAEPTRRHSLMLGITALMLLGADTYLVFAQREYLFLLLTLPYVIMHLPSVQRHSMPKLARFAIGALAAIGLCLKPHFFVLWIARLAYGTRQSRSLMRPIGWADAGIILSCIGYAAAIWVFTPEYLPWAKILSELYPGYRRINETPLDILLWFVFVAVLALAVAWKFQLRRIIRAEAYGSDIAYLAWMSAAVYLEALLQFKTWQYITYPFVAMCVITLLVIVVMKQLSHFASFALLAFVFFPYTPLTDTRQDRAHGGYELLMHELEPVRNAKQLYFLNTMFAPPGFYAHHDTLAWTSRFPMMLFVVQGMMQANENGSIAPRVKPGMERLQRWLWDQMSADLRKQPDALLIYRNEPKRDEDRPAFNLYGWMQQDAILSNQLAAYEKYKEIMVCDNAIERCYYDLYLKPEALPSGY